MPRPPRRIEPGIAHHVTNRGALGQDYLCTDRTRCAFLHRIQDLRCRWQIDIIGYALMSNHYHLVLVDNSGVLPKAMAWLQAEYSRLINRQENIQGTRVQGRYYNNALLDTQAQRHVLAYVVGNPANAGLQRHMTNPLWTSYPLHMDGHSWLNDRHWMAKYDSGGLTAYVSQVASSKGHYGHLRVLYRYTFGRALEEDSHGLHWLKNVVGLMTPHISDVLHITEGRVRYLLKNHGIARAPTCHSSRLWRSLR